MKKVNVENNVMTTEIEQELAKEGLGLELYLNWFTNAEILEGIKPTNSLPNLELVTIEGVAEYFEVSVKTIENITQKYSLILDIGDFSFVRVLSKDVLMERLQESITEVETLEDKSVITLKDGDTLEVPKEGLALYHYASMLRIAMFLNESDVAINVQKYMICRQAI
ncbi:hypothetical protein OK414_23260 [Priestia sp. JV24]|uniref:hypothetical protein n=1 Tax=Priestia TaxID=2800373 RepID=UPI0021D65D6A|nr:MULTISPECIES: hypothetical protein [Priestia]MCU7708345.1 hypothetical protein [Priestia megaterium]MCW1047971.1 hypothetical protein [Priestia sp. JV24]